MLEVKCNNCLEVLLLKDLNNHKEEKCEKTMISCSFSSYGCTEKFLRKDLEAHTTKNYHKHLLLIQESCDKKIQALESKFQESLVSLQNTVGELQTQLDAKTNTSFIVNWHVKNFSAIKKRCYKRSKAFSLGDCEWFLGAYFFGDNEDSKDYISIYLFCPNVPRNRKITLEYSVCIKNHISDSRSVTKDFVVTFPVDSGQGWGDRKAIKHEVIGKSNSGFLKNDSLTIICSLQVKSIECFVGDL